jgi:hypothetical protein
MTQSQRERMQITAPAAICPPCTSGCRQGRDCDAPRPQMRRREAFGLLACILAPWVVMFALWWWLWAR